MSNNVLLPFQPESMSASQLAAVSFLARYSGQTHSLYTYELRRALSVGFFGAASLLGYTDLLQTAPELVVLAIALNLSVPMAAWMRYREMNWQPTLEMAGSTMAVGLALIAAYWMDLVARDSLVEVQTSLACPVMLAVMLVRFRLYSGSHSAHAAEESPR
jgi:Zn-dependent protease